jgi:hypothetical protein
MKWEQFRPLEEREPIREQRHREFWIEGLAQVQIERNQKERKQHDKGTSASTDGETPSEPGSCESV